MKKTFLLTAFMLIGTCFFVGCSSEESEELSKDAQLEIIKQKYLHYAELYGVEGLQFFDEQLAKHLDLTDEQIEQDMIHVAVLSGKLHANASEIRKKHRTRSVGEPEEYYNWIRAEANGTFTDTKVVNDSISINLTVAFNYSEHGHASTTSKSATISRKYKCDNSSCTIWHLDPIDYPVQAFMCSLNIPLTNITKEEGAQVEFIITYDAIVIKKNQGFDIDERFRETVNAIGIVHILN